MSVVVCVLQHLMDRIVDHIKGTSGTRLQALTLFAYIVRKQPAWLYQVARHSLMSTITKTLKVRAKKVLSGMPAHNVST